MSVSGLLLKVLAKGELAYPGVRLRDAALRMEGEMEPGAVPWAAGVHWSVCYQALYHLMHQRQVVLAGVPEPVKLPKVYEEIGYDDLPDWTVDADRSRAVPVDPGSTSYASLRVFLPAEWSLVLRNGGRLPRVREIEVVAEPLETPVQRVAHGPKCADPPRGRAFRLAEAEKIYKAYVAKCLSAGRTPSGKTDERAPELDGISRDIRRELRKKHAPAEWAVTTPGRKRKPLAKNARMKNARK